MTNRRLLRWMFGFLRPVKLQVLLACLFLTAWVGLEVLAVRQTAEAVNLIKVVQVGNGQEASPDRTAGSDGPRDAVDAPIDGSFWSWVSGRSTDAVRMRHTVLVLAGLVGGLGVLIYLREVANARLSMHMVFHIREAVYDRLQHVGFGFHDSVSTGELINRSLTDLQNVRSFINTAVLMTLEIVLIVGGYTALLLTRSPWVAGLALLPLPIWTMYIIRFSRKVQPALKAVMEAGDRNVSLITENIAGVHVVRAFATERQEIRNYADNCDAFLSRVLTRIRLFADFTPIMRSIAILSHLSLFLAAGVMIIQGKLTAGDVLLLGSAMGAILTRLQQVAAINDQYQNAIVSSRRLHEVLHAPSTVPQKPTARPLPPGPGAVRFENVTFGYDPDRPVLHEISFDLTGESVVAIVGPTGAGKTTLASLIGRFYDPQQGRILIDGTDLRDATLASLHTQIAYVFQETYLFSDTVEANIAYGRPGIGRREVEAAARLAQADEFIQNLPAGYDTVLGERGASLSGGQRQRLAIARALVTNPRVLILDDATAAVDPEVEERIRLGLGPRASGPRGNGQESKLAPRTSPLSDEQDARAPRSTFVIAHRISTVKRADVVIVLEDGRVTQMGTHDELMLTDGHYRDIAAVQLYGEDWVGDGEDVPSHMDRVRNPRRVSEIAAAVRLEQEE